MDWGLASWRHEAPVSPIRSDDLGKVRKGVAASGHASDLSCKPKDQSCFLARQCRVFAPDHEQSESLLLRPLFFRGFRCMHACLLYAWLMRGPPDCVGARRIPVLHPAVWTEAVIRRNVFAE